MTKEQEYFNYYCLDKIKPLDEDVRVSYHDDGLIKRLDYKIGLRAKIKRVDCFVLYTETDSDLDTFLFIPVDTLYNNYDRLMSSVISKEEYTEMIKRLTSINIFEFASLLDFSYIYDEFKKFIEYNWETLDMDSLVECS